VRKRKSFTAILAAQGMKWCPWVLSLFLANILIIHGDHERFCASFVAQKPIAACHAKQLKMRDQGYGSFLCPQTDVFDQNPDGSPKVQSPAFTALAR
jgi:hypothetical protein